jgi:predicted amidohydrolase
MDRRHFMQTLSVLGLAGGGAVRETEGANPAASQGVPATAQSRASANGKPNVKFAVVQLDTIACEVNLNVHKLMIWTRNAFENKANFVFLHEGATADYTPDPLQFGRPLDGAEVHGFAMLCKRYKGFVALGLNEVFENKPYISMVWLGPEGVIGVYRKTYLWPNACQKTDAEFEEYCARYVGHREGFRLERSVLACGEGTKILQVGDLRIGCLICADGAHPKAWETFEKDKPDLIFWQNNRGNVSDGKPNRRARELGVPIVASNRCGFSHGYFQLGGSCVVADDGTTVAQANRNGEEEIIYCEYPDLIRSPL